jgi:phycocyanin-associated rod protein
MAFASLNRLRTAEFSFFFFSCLFFLNEVIIMLGQSALVGSNGVSANRVFVYEVSGLRQTEESDNNAYDFRRSGSVFLKVPVSVQGGHQLRTKRVKPLLGMVFREFF